VPVDPELVWLVCWAAPPLLAQKPVYQLWMLPRAPGTVAQAPSQGPAVAVEKAVRRASLQKQAS
jgi:hypothetical protein